MASSLSPPKSTNANLSPFPSSPAGSDFTPRKEFIQASSPESSFALLAFTSNNAIRLSNFPQTFVIALRTLLHSIIGLRSFRENAEHKLCEIILIGKPWSSPKALSTEVLLVQVFTVLCAHGYSFISQIDYGREHNDRLSLAFSRRVPPPNLNNLSAPQQRSSSSVPFALSFHSPTTLRVVCSPLHATPAILQSVRGAWPRGVTSEKKLGEGCFEFKLKGYSWFHEDTFPEDALAHILTLLTALDKHAWTITTSISLTSTRARTKDLWIFSGPNQTSSSPRDHDIAVLPATPVHLGSPLKPSIYEPIVDNHQHEGSGDSEGSASGGVHPDTIELPSKQSPGNISNMKRLSHSPNERGSHVRAASDPPAPVLRKKVPTSKLQEPIPDEAQSPREILPGPSPMARPSPSHSSRVDTTHVTSLPTVRSPAQGDGSIPPQPQTFIDPPSHPLISLPEPVTDENGGVHSSALVESGDDQTLQASGDALSPPIQTPGTDASVSTPPLLAPNAFRLRSPEEFRDSAFSDTTRQSFDVPITWVPTLQQDGDGEGRPDREADAVPRRPPPSSFPDSQLSLVTNTTGPLPPGGWAATPSTEVGNPISVSSNVERESTPRQSIDTVRASIIAADAPLRQNTVLSHSPRIVRPELPDENGPNDAGSARRKSEAGVLGVVTQGDVNAPPVPSIPGERGITVNGSVEEQNKPKEGWVFVSVAPDSGVASTSSPTSSPSPVNAAAAAQAAAPVPPSEPGKTHTPVSAAQLIAAADAVSSSPSSPHQPVDKVTSPSKPDVVASSDSSASPAATFPASASKLTLGRLFSRRVGGAQKTKAAELEGDSDKDIKEKGSRFRRKTGGGVLPTIRSGKRISID